MAQKVAATKKILENKVSDTETVIDDAKESISTLNNEIEARDDGIKSLDKSVADATEQRTKENAEDEQITFNMGGIFAFTDAPGGIAGVGISHVQAAPPPSSPETNSAYKKEGEDSNGIFQVIKTQIEWDTINRDKSKAKQLQEDYQHAQTTCPDHRKVVHNANADVWPQPDHHWQTTCPKHRKITSAGL